MRRFVLEKKRGEYATGCDIERRIKRRRPVSEYTPSSQTGDVVVTSAGGVTNNLLEAVSFSAHSINDIEVKVPGYEAVTR